MAAAGDAPIEFYEFDRANRRLTLNLHPGQRQVWASEARFTFAIAGAQSGKTILGPAWVWREMERRGPGDYGVVSATFDLFKMKVLPETKRLFCDYLDWGTYHAGDQVLMSHDEAYRIILRSAQAPGGIESGTWKAGWLDECGQDDFLREAWEATQRRLAIHEGRVLGTTTAYNMGWLYVDVHCRWKGGDPHFNVIRFPSTDNPKFRREEFERLRGTLPGWKFRMLYEGHFERPEGLIYRDYDEGRHLLDPVTPAKECPRYVGVDFGPVNTAVVWLADLGEGKYLAYRERFRGDMTGPEHARACLEYQEDVRRWAGGAKSEAQQRMDWTLAGCAVEEPPITDVEAGIDHVIGLFRQNRLLICSSLTRLRSELGTYSREVDDAGEPTARIKDKERFHMLDALRAACSMVPQQPPAGPAKDQGPKGGPRSVERVIAAQGEPVRRSEEYAT